MADPKTCVAAGLTNHLILLVPVNRTPKSLLPKTMNGREFHQYHLNLGRKFILDQIIQSWHFSCPRTITVHSVHRRFSMPIWGVCESLRHYTSLYLITAPSIDIPMFNVKYLAIMYKCMLVQYAVTVWFCVCIGR